MRMLKKVNKFIMDEFIVKLYDRNYCRFEIFLITCNLQKICHNINTYRIYICKV